MSNIVEAGTNGKTIYGQTPSVSLTDPLGNPVIDPCTGQPYVAPLGYDPLNTANQYGSYAFPSINALGQLVNDFQSGGQNDLQRVDPNGQPYSTSPKEWVPDYQDVASFNFGVACASAGIPEQIALMGAGAYNLYERTKNHQVNVGGAVFNNPRNASNIESGYRYYYQHIAPGRSGNNPFSIAPGVNTDFRSYMPVSGYDPLAINLTGGWIQTVGVDHSGVMFDTTGTGNTVASGWIANGTGLLVNDPTGATTLTSASQLVAGFSALAALDANGDGHIVDFHLKLTHLRG